MVDTLLGSSRNSSRMKENAYKKTRMKGKRKVMLRRPPPEEKNPVKKKQLLLKISRKSLTQMSPISIMPSITLTRSLGQRSLRRLRSLTSKMKKKPRHTLMRKSRTGPRDKSFREERCRLTRERLQILTTK